MKLIRQILWVVLLVLVILIFAQNTEFLLLRHPFTIHLGFTNWTFPNTSVAFLLLVVFVIGFISAYLASLAPRYRLHRKNQQLQQEIAEKNKELTQKEEELAACHAKVATLEIPHEQIELPEPKI